MSAIVPCGTTGEAPTLGGEEKKRVIAFTIKRVDGRIPVIAGCGSPSTEYAAEYAADAEKEGADGILVVTPYYNKATDNGVYLHYKTIAEAGTYTGNCIQCPCKDGPLHYVRAHMNC